MPELTVSVFAHKNEKYLEKALQNVLSQEQVEFDVIVFNHGSTQVIESIVDKINDSRITVLKDKNRRGYYRCQNLIIEKSKAPFIVHFDSDGLIIDNLAFRKLLYRIKQSSKIGLVHCYYLNIDTDGYITRDRVASAWRNSHTNITTNIDYRIGLVTRGNILDRFKIYRKDVFNTVGFFNDKLKKSEGDLEMSVRLLDRYEIKLVPEFLYARSSPSISAEKASFSKIKESLNNRKTMISNLKNKKKVNFYSFFSRYNIHLLYFFGVYRAFKIGCFDPAKKLSSYYQSLLMGIKSFSRDFDKQFYSFILKYFSWWPIELNKYKWSKKDPSSKTSRVAYYVRSYPEFSQTFIQREIAALKDKGLFLRIFADKPSDIDFVSNDPKETEDTTYLNSYSLSEINKLKKRFLLNNPIRYFSLYFYVITTRYEYNKSFEADKDLFNRAIMLASLLKKNNINHIHSPWANKYSFIALIAAKLAGVSFSVEGRAYDLNRYDQAFAHKEKFSNAEFIITNSLYNKNRIEKYMDAGSKDKVNLVYEGISLDGQNYKREFTATTKEVNVLCVARFIEEKGLDYLLQACSILKSRGYSFKCRIVGGLSNKLNIAYYIKLKVLHKQLGLGDDVILYDAVPFEEVLEYYKKSDFFVLPCRKSKKHGGRDITPNVIFEAMAYGLPVISTNITAIPEIIENDVDGLLVPSEDINSLADAMIRLIDNIELRKTLGENARRKIEDKFDINKNIEQFTELFARVA